MKTDCFQFTLFSMFIQIHRSRMYEGQVRKKWSSSAIADKLQHNTDE